MSKNEALIMLQDKRQKCIVYTRVMGYHRPTESFNTGKVGEHKQRKQFKESYGYNQKNRCGNLCT
ncbi:anaerobic ribonucleoside-triphosphate reductase [Sulfurimonas sp.]|uniref:anaerobic ribonucleoside-triphosphate reductase n=1 Tax=Sulfurimonas sp. TaxID=2022749 RepID=UPI0025FB551E|nr:anaerobic ribonucleoside-triphosphate reductase [Sulfurimonas sp.]MBW6487511.1 anaerobic ribonucleoside-triphosphate reductase [Sulfurimonas sp.]